MAVTISWVKEWSSSDDGTVLGGADIENIQTSIENHSHTTGASASYLTTFTNADLVAGVLTVTHNLDTQYCHYVIIDNNGKVCWADDVTMTSTTVTTISLVSYGAIAGTWRARIYA